MKRGWIREEGSIDSVDDIHDDFYSLNFREKLLEDDEIDPREEGFMNGYEEAV
jgi:hypothetical protein